MWIPGSPQTSLYSYLEFLGSLLNSVSNAFGNTFYHQHHSPSTTSTSTSLSVSLAPSALANSVSSSSSSTSALNYLAQANFHLLIDTGGRQTGGGGGGGPSGGGGGGGAGGGAQPGLSLPYRKRIETQIIAKCNNVFPIFNSRTRIEIIVIDLPDNVPGVLASTLRLDQDEQAFQNSWNQCLEQIGNLKHRRLLGNYNLDQTIRDLRFAKRSKVFILFNMRNDQFKLLVAQWDNRRIHFTFQSYLYFTFLNLLLLLLLLLSIYY